MSRRLLSALLLGLSLGAARAADLRFYPSFGEVSQTVKAGAAPELTFTRPAWALVQPGSLRWTGSALRRLRSVPVDNAWLSAQEGQAVTVLRAGLPPLPGTLIRAADLLVKLDSGNALNVRPDELVFAGTPPRGWAQPGVRVTFDVEAAPTGQISYRTNALSWQPRYELSASGSAAKLSALADLRNGGEGAFQGEKVELFAGQILNVQPMPAPMPVSPTQAQTDSVAMNAMLGSGGGLAPLGELRGLQRYALKGGLTLGAGETLTLPFLQPKVSAFTRYERITSYFDRSERSGSANRHYKFTPDLSLPAGPLSVLEDGALVGTVTLPAAQAGRPIDLDLGSDPELRYLRTVRQLSLEKSPDGKVLSTTLQVTYALTSTKALPIRVQLREQVYARTVVVDGQPQTSQQVNVERGVDVPAGGKASVSFRVKIAN
ncbi:DUF4139 domain-containing protein [Deinococcus koreensis]|uniref:DUF4139 domain-containing protein n=1 Tax=Deinococcus koreensis TaxID=2054903 RepID=A0A2K3UYS4_9DEIO|nr:DUF4139 domain-containing protein [Deinococcus koreensis]PNY81688.1 hypothetical protein CVO96_10160 [Deinococcus koreensis]